MEKNPTTNNPVLRTQEEQKAVGALGNSREVSVNSLEGIRVSSSGKGMGPIVQPNTSLPNKQEELEGSAQVKNCELITATGSQWDEFCDWSAVIDGYKLFRSKSYKRGEQLDSPCSRGDSLKLSLEKEKGTSQEFMGEQSQQRKLCFL